MKFNEANMTATDRMAFEELKSAMVLRMELRAPEQAQEQRRRA